jgi:hypothetical protein
VSTAAKLAGFAVVLGILFGGGAAAGEIIDPDSPAGTAAEEEHTDEAMTETAHEIHGVTVADDGLALQVDTPELDAGRPGTLQFRILDDRGAVVRDFDVEHTKRMHLIVVRRDLTGFQHLHPEQQADGSWRTALELPDAGSYRVFADFSHKGTATTLAGDLRVDGAADLRALPAPVPVADAGDGYEVRLDAGTVRAGQEAELEFTVTRNGKPVQVEPYLGANGHLVALREGDLAFLHVHPEDDGVAFGATFPSAGSYRLFLQFQHEGQVRTAAFTQEVAR